MSSEVEIAITVFSAEISLLGLLTLASVEMTDNFASLKFVEIYETNVRGSGE